MSSRVTSFSWLLKRIPTARSSNHSTTDLLHRGCDVSLFRSRSSRSGRVKRTKLNDLCLPRFKHTAGTWVDPMQPRARDTLHPLIRLWVIRDRWIIGPYPHLLISVGTSVAERGHDVRSQLFMITFDLAQLMLRQVRVSPNGYGAMNGHA